MILQIKSVYKTVLVFSSLNANYPCKKINNRLKNKKTIKEM